MRAQAHHQRQVMRSVLAGWQEHAHRKRRKRQALLQAEAAWIFMLLLRVLAAWRSAVTDTKLQALRVAR